MTPLKTTCFPSRNPVRGHLCCRLWALLLPGVILGVGSSVPSVVIVAQVPQAVAQSLATVTTDTGGLAPGHHDFARYTDPLWCVEAARHARTVLRMSLAAQAGFDTLQYMPAQDTLPAQVGRVARDCGSHFTVTGTTVLDLPYLFELALFEGADSLAQAVVARRVALATTDSARWEMLYWAIDGYLHAEPARVAAAQTLVTQLDQREPTARLARARVHTLLIDLADRSSDRLRVRHEAEYIIALIQQMSLEELAGGYTKELNKGGGQLLETMWNQVFRVAWIDAPDSLDALAQRLQTVYGMPEIRRYLRGLADGTIPSHMFGSLPPSVIHWPVGKVLAHFGPQELVTNSLYASNEESADTATVPGALMPQVHARYWFPATEGDTIQPAPGHVSLILSEAFSFACLNSLDALLANNSGCNEGLVSLLRNVLWRYGKSGLRVTVVANVFADSASVFLRGPLRPDSVAKVLAWYVHDFLKLPVTVAVDTVSLLQAMPAPDGRRFYGASAMTKEYVGVETTRGLWHGTGPLGGDHSVVVMTGRTGQIMYVGGGLVQGYLFDAMMVRALQAAPSGTPSRAPATAPPASPQPAMHP